MEAKLFWVGVELLCISYVLKHFFKQKIWEENRAFFYVVHVIFWLHVSIMGIGFLLTMKLNKEFKDVIWTSSWLSIFVVIGACAWIVYRLKKIADKTKETDSVLEKQKKLIKKTLMEEKEWIDTGISAIFMATFIMYFIVQAFKIPSGSMRTTLVEGDHLFVNKFMYGGYIFFKNR